MSKRIFIAINFSTKLLNKDLGGIKKELIGTPIKWVEPKNIHLTLLFLGSTPLKKLPLIEEAIEKNIKILSPFKMEFVSLGSFGYVIWLGAKIEPEPQLRQFLHNLKEDLRPSFAIGEQKFVPHITIGRIKGMIERGKIEKLEKNIIPTGDHPKGDKNHHFGAVEVSSIDIMESELRREGPEYKVIGNYEL